MFSYRSDHTVKAILPPFPWFGGKRRVAAEVWEFFGNVGNYVEPFFGGGAVLLGRPTEPRLETINDLDCFVANFWRGIKSDPDAVAAHADWPVNEIDLHSRHRWLVKQRSQLRESLLSDPNYFDPRIAGWWVWGQSAWLAGGWCDGRPKSSKPKSRANGVNRKSFDGYESLADYFRAIANRLRHVRVLCGDWSRAVTRAETTGLGLTAVFFDPPYTSAAGRDPGLYAEDSLSVGHAVAEWAAANGDNPKLRIALCGYEGEYAMPANWHCFGWTASGGYGNANKDNANRHRERIWFSPHCLIETEQPAPPRKRRSPAKR